jgi:glucose-6-phosphate isomerase
MALLRYWYGTSFGSTSHAVLPYDHLLRRFPDYLQQLDMESNGKSVDRDGIRIDYNSGSVIWGQSGINGQHAFYQLLHQGTRFISTDFIISLRAPNQRENHRDILFANFLAQTEALMRGRTRKQTEKILQTRNLPKEERDKLAPYMVFEGNHPSNSLVMEELTPYTLGALIALYEHKIFTQGVILNINSFDQWGVELGKTLAAHIIPELGSNSELNHDSSTNSLINLYRQRHL